MPSRSCRGRRTSPSRFSHTARNAGGDDRSGGANEVPWTLHDPDFDTSALGSSRRLTLRRSTEGSVVSLGVVRPLRELIRARPPAVRPLMDVARLERISAHRTAAVEQDHDAVEDTRLVLRAELAVEMDRLAPRDRLRAVGVDRE